MLRPTRLLVAATVVLSSLAIGVPAQAQNPGPPELPALTLSVLNACTGLPVVRASATLVNPRTGEKDPGPAQYPLLGLSVWPAGSLVPGVHALGLSAPGFVEIPAVQTDPTTGERHPGPIDHVTKDPGPPQLPANETYSEGVAAIVMMIPTSPSRFCLHLSAPALPAFSGAVLDGSTGAPIGVAPTVSLIDPATGFAACDGPPDASGATLCGRDPGPPQFFAFPSTLPAGAYDLSATAPGYLPFQGLDPTTGERDPGPTSHVTKDPGPANLPVGESASFGAVALIGLAPA